MTEIHISPGELKHPRVDERIALERAARADFDTGMTEEVARPLHHNPMVYYTVATTLMAFLAWCVIEPVFDDTADASLVGFFVFMITASMIGLALGIVYGIANRNPAQAVYCGAVGFGVGFLAALPATFVAGVIFMVGVGISAAMVTTPVETLQDIPPLSFLLLLCTRSLAWAIVGSTAGLPLGVSLKSMKLLSVGIIGGIIGGAVGGLFFDPVDRFLSFNPNEAWLSRMVGLTAVGCLVGLFVGFIENVSRTAWLQMLQGPLKGKQFNLFKNSMVLGSSPRADIYLFKDPDICPEHATITNTGSKFLLTDMNSLSGVQVNGRRVQKAVLQRGDVVTLGKTVLRYDDREKRM